MTSESRGSSSSNGSSKAGIAGSIGTFDDVFEGLAHGGPDARPVASDAQRALVARRALGRTALNGLGRSARFAGFADALLAALSELESGLLDPDQLDGDLAQLYAAYRSELEGLALWDRDLLRRRAVERLRSELDAWDGRPVFAYGFEDLTGAEWGLLEALSARAEVTVSLPYEPGRAAFASLRRTQEDLAALSGGRIDELPARSDEYGHAALAQRLWQRVDSGHALCRHAGVVSGARLPRAAFTRQPGQFDDSRHLRADAARHASPDRPFARRRAAAGAPGGRDRRGTLRLADQERL